MSNPWLAIVILMIVVAIYGATKDWVGGIFKERKNRRRSEFIYKIQTGMTQSEVHQGLGEPDQVMSNGDYFRGINAVFLDENPSETFPKEQFWTYSNLPSSGLVTTLSFDADGRLKYKRTSDRINS